MKRLVFAILVVTTMTYTVAATGELGFRVTKPLARRTSSGHSVSSNVLKLKRGGKAAKSSSYLKTLRAASAPDQERHAYGGIIPVDNLLSVEYVTEVAWNGIPVNVIIDTGSSDSWLVQDGFTCVDQQNRTQPVGARLTKRWEAQLTVKLPSKPIACSVHLFRAHSMAKLSRISIST